MLAEAAGSNYWNRPVLQSVIPVIEQSRHVRTSPEAVQAVAGWMAYETFILPSGSVGGDFEIGSNPDRIMDLTFLESTLNFAFTDFASSVKCQVRGRVRGPDLFRHGGHVRSNP
jgi:hypothetical protein